jgi:uncharacterized protein YbgA (DUF1722 family)
LIEPTAHDEAFPAPYLGISDTRDRDDAVQRIARFCHVLVLTPDADPPVRLDGVVFGNAATSFSDLGPVASARKDQLGEGAERDRFLLLLFGLARLRAVEDSRLRSVLADFHARYKYALLAYDEAGMRELGGVAASVAERPWEESVALYRARFVRALARPATTGGHVNALTHVFGHLSDRLAAGERQFFLRQLDDARAGRLPPSGALSVLRSWLQHVDVPYIAAQAYLAPCPEVLRRRYAAGRDAGLT